MTLSRYFLVCWYEKENIDYLSACFSFKRIDNSLRIT